MNALGTPLSATGLRTLTQRRQMEKNIFPQNGSQFGAYSPGGAVNNINAAPDAFRTVSSIKSQPINDRITDLFNQYDALRTQGNDATNQYTQFLNQSNPAARNNLNQENAVVGGYYDGTVSNRLAQLRAQRQQAAQMAGDRAMGAARRGFALNRMGNSSSAGGAGNSSYLAKLAMDKSADIATKLALDAADAERADLDYLNNAQLALRNARTQATDAYGRRTMMPVEAGQQDFAAMAAMLREIMAQDQGNTFYGLAKQRGVT